MDAPDLKEGEWITIGKSVSAVVSKVYNRQALGVAEVVYLQGHKAINDDIKWAEDHWEFMYDRPSGGYADKNPRLAGFVIQLKASR